MRWDAPFFIAASAALEADEDISLFSMVNVRFFDPNNHN